MTNPEAGEPGPKPLEKYSISQHIARFYVAINGNFRQMASDGVVRPNALLNHFTLVS
ncbi:MULTISPECIES: hypothetical protein [Sphingobacterium]|uniref:hypothetical protein n=1 Tax=Sphingobacterium TaxID=28453 RepID=UPI00135B0464|nr:MULTISPECIES: hypothetical protein [Sphingobacterium]MCS4163773.1 hypothetical protein [Sphingobacterium sp. BIGb0116]